MHPLLDFLVRLVIKVKAVNLNGPFNVMRQRVVARRGFLHSGIHRRRKGIQKGENVLRKEQNSRESERELKEEECSLRR